MSWFSPKPHAALDTAHDLKKPLSPELAKQLADGLLPPRAMVQARDYLARASAPVNPDPARFAVAKSWDGSYGLATIPQANASAEALLKARASWGAKLKDHFRGSWGASLRTKEVDGSGFPQPEVLSQKQRDLVGGGATLDLDSFLRAKTGPGLTGYPVGGPVRPGYDGPDYSALRPGA